MFIKYLLYDLVWTFCLLSIFVVIPISIVKGLTPVAYLNTILVDFMNFAQNQPAKLLLIICGAIAYFIFYYLRVNKVIKEWAKSNNYSILSISRCRMCNMPFKFSNFFFPNYQIKVCSKAEDDKNMIVNLGFGYGTAIESIQIVK